MNRRHRLTADYLKQNPPLDEESLCHWSRFYKSADPSFNEDIFRRYIRGECGPNGGKIKKKQPKHMIYDGLDLSEMIEE